MASFMLLKAEVKPLTRAVAEQFKGMEPSPTERDLDPARLKHLKGKAEGGHLVTFHWATAKMGGRVLRVNGQHSSNMLCELADPFPEGLQVHLDHYEVDGPDGLALLFRQFDDRKSGRSAADVAGAYQGLCPELANVSKPIAKLGIDGVAWYRRHVLGNPVASGDQVYELLQEKGLHGFLLWLNDIFSIKTPELKKVQVVSAMYGTFISNEAAARKFWDEVARGGIEFEDNAPSTILDGWLKAAKEGAADAGALKPGNFYQGCIYGWNAFREGKTIKTIKFGVEKGWLEAND
jgi:hypothetical protein